MGATRSLALALTPLPPSPIATGEGEAGANPVSRPDSLLPAPRGDSPLQSRGAWGGVGLGMRGNRCGRVGSRSSMPLRASNNASAIATSSSCVTFKLATVEGTTVTGTPTASQSKASSVTCLSPQAAIARRKRSSWNACGVCAAHSAVRSTVSLITPSATRFNVSATGAAAMAAPLSIAARTQRLKSSGAARGRAAS